MYTTSEYDIMQWVLGIVCTMGTVGAFYTCFMIVYQKRLIKQPYIFCLAVSSGSISFSHVMALFFSRQQRYCKGVGTPIQQTDGFTFCMVQGGMLQYFGLTAPMFWLAMACELYAKIVLRMKAKDVETYIPKIVTFIWSFCLLPLIIAASKSLLGASQPTPWCFYSGFVASHYDIGLFYIPLVLVVIVGTLVMIRVLSAIYAISFPSMTSMDPVAAPGTNPSLATTKARADGFHASWHNPLVRQLTSEGRAIGVLGLASQQPIPRRMSDTCGGCLSRSPRKRCWGYPPLSRASSWPCSGGRSSSSSSSWA